uniref:Uncharacterized protein n=1 Tax=Romanomermis culicivorax TaxID=13658 RepID=A0A915KNJ5_ROMCU
MPIRWAAMSIVPTDDWHQRPKLLEETRLSLLFIKMEEHLKFLSLIDVKSTGINLLFGQIYGIDGKGHDISTLIHDALENENKKNNAVLFGLRPDPNETDLVKVKNLVDKYAPNDDSLQSLDIIRRHEIDI